MIRAGIERAWHAGSRAVSGVGLWLAVLFAAASGLLLSAGYPALGWWPLTWVGIGVMLWGLPGRSVWGALLVGMVGGLSYYLSLIPWVTLFLGPLPYSALATLEAMFFAVGSLAIALAYRWVARAWPGILGRLLLLPTVVAGLWTAREAISSTWPYGGFAWGRVALSQSQSPIAPLFAWLGVSGVSFAMVFLAALTVEIIRDRRAAADARLTLVATVATLLVVFPAFPTVTHGSIRVAAVQGNAQAGYFQQRELGENLQAQVDATEPLYGKKADVVLWPEGATDIDPLESRYAAEVFDYVSKRMGAPLVAGAITHRGSKYYNTSLLWEPGKGAVDHYDKKHPVPFGEYVPDRSFWSLFAPDLIGLIQRDYTPGTTNEVFSIGHVIAGINICFDISDDQVMTDSVREGAQVIFAQTNNADFGHTEESVQQLAIARIRAIELGRSVVNISTVGTSAIIRPDGSTLDSLPTFTAAAMIDNVPLSTVTTPAVVVGRQLEWLVSGLGLGAVIVSALTLRGTLRAESTFRTRRTRG